MFACDSSEVVSVNVFTNVTQGVPGYMKRRGCLLLQFSSVCYLVQLFSNQYITE